MKSRPRDDYTDDILRALATPGGHLMIGRYGHTLHAGNCRISGCIESILKPAAIAAGLPVIDNTTAPFELAALLAISGPMIAVNEAPSARPWDWLARAPLAAVATASAWAGSEVSNVGLDPEHDVFLRALPPGPREQQLRAWLDFIRTPAN